MSNFRQKSYRSPTNITGNPLAYTNVKQHIRSVLSAKGNTAGFPVSSLLPDSYVSTNPWGIDLDTTQNTKPFQHGGLERLHSNHWINFPVYLLKFNKK